MRSQIKVANRWINNLYNCLYNCLYNFPTTLALHFTRTHNCLSIATTLEWFFQKLTLDLICCRCQRWSVQRFRQQEERRFATELNPVLDFRTTSSLFKKAHRQTNNLAALPWHLPKLQFCSQHCKFEWEIFKTGN